MLSILSYLKAALVLCVVVLFFAGGGTVQAQNFNYWFNEGLALYEMGDYEDSLESFERALEENPSHSETHIFLVSALMRTGDFERAAKRAEAATDRFPNHARLLALQADAVFRVNPEDAVPVYNRLRRLIRNQPGRSMDGITLEMTERSMGLLYEQIGAMRYDRNDFNGAVDALQQARRFIPDSLSVHNNLAYILVEQEEYDRATIVLDEALERFPEEDNLLLMQVRIASQTGSGERAAETLKRLHQRNPENVDRAIAYGEALLSSNQAVKANEFFRDMIETYPEERRFYRTLIEINRRRMNLSGMHQVIGMKAGQFPEDRTLAEEYSRSFLMQREYEEAHRRYDSLSVATSSVRLGRLAAHALLFGDAHEAASEYYITLENKWPEDTRIIREHGLLLEYLNREREAAERFRKYLEKQQDGRLMIKLADLTGDERKREELLDQAFETSYRPFAERRRLKAVFRDDTDFEQAGQVLDGLIRMYAGRQQSVSSAVERDLENMEPSVPRLFHPGAELSEVLDELSVVFDRLISAPDSDRALQLFDTLSENWPNSAMLHYQKGRLYANKSNYEQAVDEITEAINLGASGNEVHMDLGEVWRKKGNYDQAALAFERVLSRDDEFAGAYRSLIRVSEEHGRLGELTDRWLSRYRNNRNNIVLREFLIEALHKADRFEEAAELN